MCKFRVLVHDLFSDLEDLHPSITKVFVFPARRIFQCQLKEFLHSSSIHFALLPIRFRSLLQPGGGRGVYVLRRSYSAKWILLLRPVTTGTPQRNTPTSNRRGLYPKVESLSESSISLHHLSVICISWSRIATQAFLGPIRHRSRPKHSVQQELQAHCTFNR